MRFGLKYNDPGANYYEERYHQRVLHNLRRKAEHLGYALVEAPAPGGVSLADRISTTVETGADDQSASIGRVADSG